MKGGEEECIDNKERISPSIKSTAALAAIYIERERERGSSPCRHQCVWLPQVVVSSIPWRPKWSPVRETGESRCGWWMLSFTWAQIKNTSCTTINTAASQVLLFPFFFFWNLSPSSLRFSVLWLKSFLKSDRALYSTAPTTQPYTMRPRTDK